MRELKFRCFINEQVGFVYFGIGEDYLSCTGNDGSWYSGIEIKDHKNIEQYTGLKDKNGKEIYEGDIVKHERIEKCSCGHTDKIIKNIGIVIFENGGFGVDMQESNDGLNCFDGIYPITQYGYYEIIGNINTFPILVGFFGISK